LTTQHNSVILKAELNSLV